MRPRPKSELRSAEGATWGPRPGAQPANRAERPRMRLVGWKPLVKGTLRGFANVELPIGLRLIDCPIFVGPNGPGRPCLPSPFSTAKGGRPGSAASRSSRPLSNGETGVWLSVSRRPLSRWSRALHPDVLSERAP